MYEEIVCYESKGKVNVLLMNTAFCVSVCFVFSRTSEDRHGHANQDTERLLLSVVYTLWLTWYKVVQYGKKKKETIPELYSSYFSNEVVNKK